MFAALLAAPRLALAQEWTSIRGIRVVADVRGSKRATKKIGKPLKRRLVEAIGPLVSPKDLASAQRKMKLKGKRARSPRNLARAGLKIGAEHIIDVYVKKRGRGASVRTRIIDVATSEIAFEEKTKIASVKREGAGHGRAIGDRLIERLQAITNAYGGAVTAKPPPAPPPSDATVLPETTVTAAPFSGDPDEKQPPEPTPPPATPPPPPVASAGETDDGGVKWFSAGGEVASGPSDAPPPPPADAQPPPPPSSPSSWDDLDKPSSSYEAPPPATVTEPGDEFIRMSLRAGAGLVRDYTLATNEGSSALSYQLSPLSMFELDFELRVPRVDVGVVLEGAFRPVGYEVDRGSEGVSFPSGLLIDFAGGLRYHAEVLGEGREALQVIPNLGLRVASSSVEQHPSNVIPSATTVAVRVGADVRYPVNDIFEVDGGLALGLIVSYTESPLASGNSNGGFNAGVNLGARVWLTPYLGLTFENAFNYDTIGFSDQPERTLPPDEEGRLSDVTITVLDVRSSVGVVFRF